MRKYTLKEISRFLIIPIILLIAYFGLVLLWDFFSIPPPDQLALAITIFFQKYGLIVLFLSALIEGVMVLGLYFPGGIIIFIGVISAGKNVPRLIEIILLVSLAYFIAYFIDYLLGKHGWHKLLLKFGFGDFIERTKEKIQKHAFITIFVGYWESNLSTITATSAGILNIPLKKFLFYSAFAILFWNIFFGVLVYYIGETALKFGEPKYILLGFFIWILTVILMKRLINRKNELPSYHLDLVNPLSKE